MAWADGRIKLAIGAIEREDPPDSIFNDHEGPLPGQLPHAGDTYHMPDNVNGLDARARRLEVSMMREERRFASMLLTTRVVAQRTALRIAQALETKMHLQEGAFTGLVDKIKGGARPDGHRRRLDEQKE